MLVVLWELLSSRVLVLRQIFIDRRTPTLSGLPTGRTASIKPRVASTTAASSAVVGSSNPSSGSREASTASLFPGMAATLVNMLPLPPTHISIPTAVITRKTTGFRFLQSWRRRHIAVPQLRTGCLRCCLEVAFPILHENVLDDCSEGIQVGR